MAHFNKERVIMLTEYFLTNDKPITVKKIQQMFERYSGEKVRRQTIYDDLNAVDIVIGLKRERVPHRCGWTLQWSKLNKGEKHGEQNDIKTASNDNATVLSNQQRRN